MVQQAEKEISSPENSDYRFEAMLANERTRLVRFCAYLTHNPDVAEDLVQETLLEAWRNQHKLCEQDVLNPGHRAKWLVAIARNVCMRWARKHSRDLSHLAPSYEDGYETEFEIEDVATDDYNIEIELEREELAQLLDRALALLPPATRDVLIERYIHESPHAEIAGRLGLSEDALIQRLHRGKLALRRVITTQMGEEAEAYGLTVPDEERLRQETRIWCPMCGKSHLTKFHDPSTSRTGFICPHCWHIACPINSHNSGIWSGLNSPKCILARQLIYLGNYYWQAINTLQARCELCGRPAQARICMPLECSQMGGLNYHGVYIFCPACQYEDLNTLPHLTLDTPEAQQFWRKYPRIRWLPGGEIEYNGQPSLVSSFQSTTRSAQIDVIFQRDALKVLGIHEQMR